LSSGDQPESGEELVELLERHGEVLAGLAGVIGTAIGRGSDREPAIHVYVMSESDVARVRGEAERALGDPRVEVIVTGMPEAQGGA
jgi:hypothetical protein